MVLRSGEVRTVHSDNLIVGDRIRIKSGMVLNIDIVLVQGRVVIDESKMTGESVPRTKVPPQDSHLTIGKEESKCILGAQSLIEKANMDIMTKKPTAAAEDETDSSERIERSERSRATVYDGDVDENLSFAVMYAGTTVITATEDALGVVYRTGYRTSRGIWSQRCSTRRK